MVFFFFSFILFICALVENRIVFRLSSLIVGGYFSFTFAYGYDWLNYYQSYKSVAAGGLPFFSDLGFIYLMKLCVSIGIGYGGFNLVVNSIMYSLIYSFCKGLKCPSMAFFIIFSFLGFYMFTEQIRQGFALSIVIFAFAKYFNSSNVKFIILVLIASFFHLSAMLALFYFITYCNSKKGFLFSLICSSFLYSFFILLLQFPSAISFLEVAQEKFEAYGTMYSDLNINFFSFILHAKMLFVYLLLAIILYFFNLKEKSGSTYSTYSNIYILMLTRSSSLLVRVGYYFLPILVYSLDGYFFNLGRGLQTNWKKLTIMILVLFVSSLPIWTPMYEIGAQSNLNVFSSPGDFNKEISRKCTILHVTSDIRTDGCS